MISADVKANVKQQEIKLFAILFKFSSEAPSKLEIQSKNCVHFSFNFGWYSIQLDIVH